MFHVQSLHVRANQSGTEVVGLETGGDVGQLQIFDVPGIEAVGGHRADVARFGITRSQFRRHTGGIPGRAATATDEADVVQPHAVNRLVRQAGDFDSGHRTDAVHDNVGNENVPHPAGRGQVGRAVAFTGGEVNAVSGRVHHGQVVDGDVFHEAAVHFLERQATTSAKGAVGDGAIAKAAAGFGAEFDASV